MIFINEFTSAEVKPREAMEKFLLCLAPFAPHIAEELWHKLGKTKSIVLESYPDYSEEKCLKQQIEFVLQVSSKIRSKIQLAPDAPRDVIEKIALADANVIKFMEGKPIKKVIFVPNKLINFIV